MKSTKKTYGVHGLMEWHANISCGKATMTVPFTGGSLSGYGVTPATFTTEHPFTQMVIENSSYFKSGKIKLMREVEGSGKYEVIGTGVKAPGTGAAQGTGAPAGGQRPSTADDEAGVNTPGTVADEGGEDPEMEAEGGEYEEAEAEGKAVVEVSDIDDARDYLAEEFGIARSTMRSNAGVMRAAAEHNIVFKGLE